MKYIKWLMLLIGIMIGYIIGLREARKENKNDFRWYRTKVLSELDDIVKDGHIYGLKFWCDRERETIEDNDDLRPIKEALVK